jgi:hypothetical protein
MAVTSSGLFVATWIDIVDATQLAIDLSLTTHRVALFNNTLTPNFSTDTAYGVAPYNANEVSGTGWAAGGVLLSTAAAGGTSLAPTVTEAPAGTLMYDWTNDLSVPSTTLTGARCALLYADALAGNNGIVLINFGADYSTNNGTFGLSPAAAGVFTLDLTP